MDSLSTSNAFSNIISGISSDAKNYDEVRKRATQVMTRLQQSKNNLLPTLYEIDHRSITHIMAKITHFTESADNLIEQLEFLEKRIETQKANIEVLMNSSSNSEDVIEKLFQLPSDIALNLCHEILDLKISGEKVALLVVLIATKVFCRLKTGQVTPEQRSALCMQVAEKGDSAVQALIDNFDKFDLGSMTPEQRLELYAKICSRWCRADEGYAVVYLLMLDKLDLRNTTPEQRLELYAKFVDQGAYATKTLIDNFNKLNLQNTTPEQRLRLCTKMAEQGTWAIKALSVNFDKFDLASTTPELRLELYAKIADQGYLAVKCLLDHFDKLSLQNITSEQCLALFIKIAEKGDGVTQALIDNFGKLGLETTTSEQRLRLWTKMAEHGDFASIYLIDNFEMLDLGNTVPQQRLELCTKIAVRGGLLVGRLVRKLHKFDLGKATPSDRLKLYKVMMNQGSWGLQELARNFDQLEIENSGQRLEFCKEFLNRGGEVAEVLAENFEKIALDRKDLFSFFCYVVVKGLQKHFLKQNVFDSISNESIKRQILIDLLTPPSGLHELGDVTQLGSFISGSETFIPGRDPIIAILNKKPGQMDETDIEQLKTFINAQQKLNFLNSLIARIETETKETVKKNIQKESQKPVKKSEETIRREAEFVRKELITWVAYTAAVLYDLDNDLITSFVQTKVLDHISSYSNPSLRYTFMRAFSQLNPAELTAFYKVVIYQKSSVKKQEPSEELDKEATANGIAPLTQLQKSAFLLAPLTNFGLSPKKLIALQEQILGTRCLKQIVISSALAQLLSTVILNGPYATEEADKIADCIIKSLKQPKMLTKPKKKVDVAPKEGEEKVDQEVHQQRKEEQTKKDLVAFMNILQIFGRSEMINFVNPGHEAVSAVAFFQISFKKLFSVQEFPDFEKQYQKTFGQFRDPMALFSYYRSVDRLPNDEKTAVMKALNVYVNSVLREDFQAVRSNPANSAHLQHIFTTRPELQTLWCESLGSKNVAGGEAEVKENEEQSSTRLQVVETVDPCDLLMIGTELKNSCQTIYGNPLKNRALVSYLMNGEIRAFAVKQGNRLVARVLLRLMWDDTNQCPILLQEKLYSNVDDPAVAQAINDLVKEKAKVMGLNVVTKGVEGVGVPYQGTVKFLGGFAPVGYCDSGEGLVIHKEEHDKTVAEGLPKPPANAPFNVVDTCLLYSPYS